MTAKRVFLLSNYFTLRKDYWVVADDKKSAIAKTREGSPPYYREEGSQEFEETEFQQELGTVTLFSNRPDSPHLISMIHTRETSDAYYGYEVKVDEEVVEIEERRYPKSEWRAVDGMMEERV